METLYRLVNYKIEITEIEKPIPDEYVDDFKEWIKSKAVELGLGNHYEYYYDHDETGVDSIGVIFNVSLMDL